MSIAVAQPRCIALDVTANAVAHAQAVRAAEARVVVFPEMSLTGYELDAEPVVPDDERLAPIVIRLNRPVNGGPGHVMAR